MRIFVIDPDVGLRETVQSRVQEALRQLGLKRAEIQTGGLDLLNEEISEDELGCCFLGPGCYDDLEQIIAYFRSVFPTAPIAVILENEVYSETAVELRRVLDVRLMPLADIAQMAGFILDCENELNALPGTKSRGVITVTHLKGGVGATTIAVGLGSCWARNGLSVAMIDLDDVNPQLSDWSRAGPSQRSVMSELLRQGDVPRYRVNELVHQVEGYDGKLVVVPQPEMYQESFHFKADMIESAPSSAVFLDSLVSALREEFDILVIDGGNSWGIGEFSALPLSQQVLLVSDDDGMSVRRSLDNLQRLANESDDPDEFDLSKWSFVLNAYSGRLLTPKDIGIEIQDMDLFPETSALYTVPFSERGRQWGGPGQSFYDLAEPTVQASIEKMAFNLVPFRQETQVPLYERLMKQFTKFRNEKRASVA